MTRTARLALVLVLGLSALAGCTTLPESGPVHTLAESNSDLPNDAPDFSPDGPSKDATPMSIVSGFLEAMTANPISTTVARTFLSERARQAWQPNRSTLLFSGTKTITVGSGSATMRLGDAQRLDSRGGWRGGEVGTTENVHLRLVQEDGQWRIDDPPDELIVPTAFFELAFARFNLYFFDQTGHTLLPDPVFIPRGEQTATNLVRGLLAGPGSSISDISRSAFPRHTALNLSVPVTNSGVAEVPLSREILAASKSDLTRVVDQLAWTLRQVPGIESVRLTVDDAPVPLPGGIIDAPINSGPEYDAGGTGAAFLWGIRGGRVVDLGSQPNPVAGPLGRSGYAMRSLAVSESPRSIAAISTNGTTAFVAPSDANTAGGRVSKVVTDGTDLLRPQYDLFGDLWLIDQTRDGARVMVVRGRTVREIDVPGVTGANVAAFSVARDGARLAVAYAGTPAPPLRVVDILRTDEGIVSGAGRSRTFFDGRSDAARIVDIGWRDPATLAVLTRPTGETSEVTFVSADGSPVDNSVVEPSVFRGAAQALVVAPDTGLALRLITPDQRLYTLGENGSWPRTSSKVVAGTYVR